MDVEKSSDWLGSYSISERIRLLGVIYGRLTISARALFLPERIGKEQRTIEALHGLNEVHHTIANMLVAYATDPGKAFPTTVFFKQLQEIESQYRLEPLVTVTLESVRGN